VIFVLYIVLCITLSLDALINPAPSGRLMGDLARQRARPWLMAASLSFLSVGLLLALVLLWVAFSGDSSFNTIATTIGWFDIIISSCIALAVLLIGQALVSYEVFTGKTLPRRGLRRQWRDGIILAAGFSAVVGGVFTWRAQTVYVLLLCTLIITVFYALYNWRTYTEREQYMQQLRPFIASQGLYEQLRARGRDGALPADFDIAKPFQALCADVLAARLAYLIPLGPLAPLAGPGLVYPLQATLPPLGLNSIVTQFHSPATMCVAVNSASYHGATWAIPLWSEQGLIGVLLLGEKHDGGLYTQEEIEIARASSERLLDTQAGAEMGRRLMALQRQRLAESQVIDQRARRVLHDDVLPRLHTAMLNLSATPEAAESVALLAEAHRQISDLMREIATSAAPDVARDGVIGALRRAVENDLAGAFDGVAWDIHAQTEQKLRALPGLMAEVVFYAAREAMRNAARHGRGGDETRPLHLLVTAACNSDLDLNLTIEDDGMGLGAEGAPGSSGQGLALHGTMMAVIGGSLAVDSQPGAYTRVALYVPHA
jgi:signal transduction histidine kinase